MDNETVMDFLCEIEPLESSPHSIAPPKRKEKWTLCTKDDELYIVNSAGKNEITINRRGADYHIQFPIFSSWADMIIQDARGDEWGFHINSDDADRVERWWTWYSQHQGANAAQVCGNTQSGQRTGLAVASLVCAIIAAWISILSIPAIICGHLAMRNIARTPRVYGGKGIATAGLILGYIALILALAVGFMRGALKMELINMGAF